MRCDVCGHDRRHHPNIRCTICDCPHWRTPLAVRLALAAAVALLCTLTVGAALYITHHEHGIPLPVYTTTEGR